MAGVEGVEPSPAVLETDVLPLYYTPMRFYILQKLSVVVNNVI